MNDMNEIVLLDAGPLGMISNPSATPASFQILAL